MFRPKRQVLLTGAGFSKDFGGYLATEMWSVIFSQPEIARDRDLRAHLLSQLNYEMAYNDVMHSGNFGSEAQAAFTTAIRRSYQQMHEAELRKPASRVCRAIVGAFGGSGSEERGFVFTLNQDLFMERFFTNGSDSLFDLSVPGISNFGCFRGTLPETQTDEYKFHLPDNETVERLQSGFWNDRVYGHFVYLKLHGSYWWKSSDGSDAMVVGGEKVDLIEHEPYIKWSHSVFEKILSGPACDLVVIGYGFGDRHINKVIANAILEHKLKLYIVSPEPPEELRNKLIPIHGNLTQMPEPSQEGDRLWQGLHGYYCCRVTDLYREDSGDLTPRGRSLFDSVGL